MKSGLGSLDSSRYITCKMHGKRIKNTIIFGIHILIKTEMLCSNIRLIMGPLLYKTTTFLNGTIVFFSSSFLNKQTYHKKCLKLLVWQVWLTELKIVQKNTSNNCSIFITVILSGKCKERR